eukprot:m.176806 g.176806  ORF g.176806 m.176806 type:complete len:374 (-) comp14235_c0_seq1:176-1297(-)
MSTRQRKPSTAPPPAAVAKPRAAVVAEKSHQSRVITLVVTLGVCLALAIVLSWDVMTAPKGAGKGNPFSGLGNNDNMARMGKDPNAGKRKVANGLRVDKAFKHDPLAFTQGLAVHAARNELYESTGMYGQSTVRLVEPATGKVLKQVKLSDNLFGEGIALTDDYLILLTWREHTGKVYELGTLTEVMTFDYKGVLTTDEGWGITYDNIGQLYVSDGSEHLHVWMLADVMGGKPANLEVITVRYPDGTPCKLINELEYIEDAGGVILANIWYQDIVVVIDPHTGYVIHTYDFAKLHKKRAKREDCFNGIAFNATDRSLLLTGKYWPKMYKVDLPEQLETFEKGRREVEEKMNPDGPHDPPHDGEPPLDDEPPLE